jgi:hypothetical protein
VKDLRRILELDDYTYTYTSDPRVTTIKRVMRYFGHAVVEKTDIGNFPLVFSVENPDSIERGSKDWDSNDPDILVDQLYVRAGGEG